QKEARAKAPVVAILSWSIDQDVKLLAASPDSVCRGIALALGESLWARSAASPAAILPIAGGGVVRWGERLGDEAARAMCRGSISDAAAIVTGHVRAAGGEIEVELRIIDPKDPKRTRSHHARGPNIAAVVALAESMLVDD